MKLQKYRVRSLEMTGRTREETFVEATCPGTAVIRAGFLGYSYQYNPFMYNGNWYYVNGDHTVRVTLQA